MDELLGTRAQPERRSRSGSRCAEVGTGRAVLSPRPFSRSGSLPPLRFGQFSLDEAEHFLHNRVASAAKLRWCSGSSRKSLFGLLRERWCTPCSGSTTRDGGVWRNARSRIWRHLVLCAGGGCVEFVRATRVRGYQLKIGMWTSSPEPPEVSVAQIDGEKTTGNITLGPTSAGLPGPLPSTAHFPSPGCWEITARGATGIAFARVNIVPLRQPPTEP
jgi:hypothetical protein